MDDQQNTNTPTIEELENKIIELENNWKRALADFRNLEKRTHEEKMDFAEFANFSLLRRIMPVVDNLHMLDEHLQDTGLKMILKEFLQILEEEGIKEIEAIGKNYDASTREAIELINGELNKVILVTQKGYFYKTKLLRPARVKVGKGEN